MDHLVRKLGTASHELGTVGGVQSQPSEVDKRKFEVDIWAAFTQCFLSYEEAVKAIEDFALGLPA